MRTTLATGAAVPTSGEGGHPDGTKGLTVVRGARAYAPRWSGGRDRHAAAAAEVLRGRQPRAEEEDRGGAAAARGVRLEAAAHGKGLLHGAEGLRRGRAPAVRPDPLRHRG